MTASTVLRPEATPARRRPVLLSLIALALLLLFDATSGSVRAETLAAEAADRTPLSVAVFLSSRQDVCFDPGDVGAIRRLASQEEARINAQGGIAGHPLHLEFLDDKRDEAQTVENVKAALADPAMLAMIGLSSSQRAKKVFEVLGPRIRESEMPFVSDISINSIFADYPNVFTTRASQDDERLPVMIRFIQDSGFQRVAYLGIKDLIFSAALGEGLQSSLAAERFAGNYWLTLKDDKLDPAEVAATAQSLKEKSVDLVVLTIGTSRNPEVISALVNAGVTPAILLSGRIDSLPAEMAKSYANDIYQLAWDRLPDLANDRLYQRIISERAEDWIFEGGKIAEAPGWATGECKPRPQDAEPDPLTDANMRAVGVGTQYADMVSLVSALAGSAPLGATLTERRRHVVERLKTTFAFGRGAFQGGFENWSFRPQTRAAVRTPFIVRLPRGLGETQLAPRQYVRLKTDKLRAINTLYLDIDLIRAFRIDDNEKSFFAEFYLSLRNDANGTSIDTIEFANAFLDPRTNDRQLTIRTLSRGGANDAYPDGLSIYHVAGRFMFEPDLHSYPFDSQRFAIDIRPKRGDAPFIVQPPPDTLRDNFVATDGWTPKTKYVGFDEEFVQTVDALSHEPSVVPFYKTSFVWLMARQTTDYYLRVVVPLGFILIVAYLSIFIPLSHFEAIVTIQVTALLSAVALYLSLPKLDADTTTVSDRIFLFNYMAVSLMIGLSILRMNRFVIGNGWARGSLAMVHIVAIPLLVLAMAIYVLQAQMSAG